MYKRIDIRLDKDKFVRFSSRIFTIGSFLQNRLPVLRTVASSSHSPIPPCLITMSSHYVLCQGIHCPSMAADIRQLNGKQSFV